VCSTVYHPSGETALPSYLIKIVVKVLVFIKDHQFDPYHVVSDYWVYHCEYCRLIVLRIVLFPEAVFRSEVEF
jgi:hypothetical protein